MPITPVDTLSSGTDFPFFDGYVPVIKDLSIARISGSTWIYGQTANPGDGVVLMRMNNAGALTYLQNTGFFGTAVIESYDPDDPSGLSLLSIDGTPYLVGSNYFNDILAGDTSFGLQLYTVAATGALEAEAFFDAENTFTRLPAGVQIGSDAFAVELLANAGGRFNRMMVSEITENAFGVRAETRTFTLPGGGATGVFAAGGFEAVGGGSDPSPVIAYVRNDNNSIQYISAPSFGIERTGTLAGSGAYGADGVPTDMEFVSLGDMTLLIATNPTRGLQAYDMDDFFNPGLAGKVGGASAVESWEAEQIVTFTYQGRTFIVTAGDDLGVFEVNEKREVFSSQVDFYLSDIIARDGGDIHDIAFHQQAGNGYILVTSDDGVSSFLFEPGQTQNQDGTTARDVLIGDNRDNILAGLGSNDSLNGLDGNDELLGGAGADDASGGAGDDDIYGGSGNDTLAGGTGDDTINGDNGRDTIMGGSGGDFIYGGSKSDNIKGGSSRDQLNGGTGRDQISGEAGNDIIKGGSSNDTLKGGKGDDVVNGGSGSDTIIGGTGQDTLYGGSGKDVFVFGDVKKRDTIRDWEDQDRIDMRDFGNGGRFRDVDIFERSDGALRVEYENRTLIVDVNKGRLEANDLRADDFIF